MGDSYIVMNHDLQFELLKDNPFHVDEEHVNSRSSSAIYTTLQTVHLARNTCEIYNELMMDAIALCIY